MDNKDSLFYKIFKFKKTNTNVDILIGKIALVTEDIDNLLSKGQVYINNDYWSAINVEDKVISKGTKVKVLEIKGVKLVVKTIS